jgi:hypothetical protein
MPGQPPEAYIEPLPLVPTGGRGSLHLPASPNGFQLWNWHLTGLSVRADDLSMPNTPGVDAATILFDQGLWFEAVVRGLETELGFSAEQASLAAAAAAARRLDDFDPDPGERLVGQPGW